MLWTGWAGSACSDEIGTATKTVEPFFFIQMTDPQLYGIYGGKRITDHGFEHEDVLFERAIEHANRLRPAFVVITGDLVQHQCRDNKEVTAFKRIARELSKGVPLHLVAGNHDVSPSKTSLDLYKKTFGRDRYSFKYKACCFIVLNSQFMRTKNPHDGEEALQLEWLKEELRRAGEEGVSHIIVFMHHSIFLSDPEEKTTKFNFPIKNRKLYLHLFEKYGVRAVFSGHYHRNCYGKYKDIELITTSAACMAMGKEPPGFRIVKVYQDHIEHKYYGYDAMPHEIGME